MSKDEEKSKEVCGISVKGHYEGKATYVRDEKAWDRVWIPDYIIIECSCGAEKIAGEFFPNVCSQCDKNYQPLVDEVERCLAEVGQHLTRNSVPLQSRSHEKDQETRKVYQAQEIVQVLRQDPSSTQAIGVADTSDGLNQRLCDPGDLVDKARPAFKLKDAIVLGELDLRHCTVNMAVETRNCLFTGEIDLRYCEFKQTVDFSKCTFGKEFNSGDETESHTIYRKDLICKKSRFKEAARFNGIKVEGGAYFDGSKFESEGISKPLQELSASDFASDFTTASIDGVFVCRGVVFEGSVSLNTLKCGLNGFFTGTHFKGGANFRFASFGINIRLNKVEFGGDVDFRGVTCTNLYCSFPERDTLPYEGTIFKGKVDLRALKCTGLGFFRGTTFTDESKDVDFRFTCFGGDLDFRYAYFAGKVRLGDAEISQKLRLGGSRFKGEVELYGMEIKILELLQITNAYPIKIRISERQDDLMSKVEDQNQLNASKPKRQPKPPFQWQKGEFQGLTKEIFPFKNDEGWDLTGTTFNRFHGGPDSQLEKELAKRLVEGQDPTKFSRDPYLQLEKHYNNTGEEDDAKKVHYDGHKALRQNAKDSRKKNGQGRVSWAWPQIWVTDFGLKWFTGYGHKGWRAVSPLPILFIVGTWTFWGSNKLVERNGTTTTNLDGSIWHSLIYNLDLLIPVLTFPSTAQWVPAPNYTWGEIWSVVEVVAGWLLVPLAIAAWTGIIKINRE